MKKTFEIVCVAAVVAALGSAATKHSFRWFVVSLILVTTIFFPGTSVPAHAQEVSLPGQWYDQDKNHEPEWHFVDSNGDGWWDVGEPWGLEPNPSWGPYYTPTGRRWTQECYDDTDGDGWHNPGEPHSEHPRTEWANPLQTSDNSCWTASAANLVCYLGGANPYQRWAYDMGVNGKSFSSGGEPGEALVSDGFRVTAISKGLFDALWLTDPVEWTQARLEQDLPVAIGTGVVGSLFGQPRHALTVYAIDTELQTVTIGDSDRDEETYTTYPYTQDLLNWILPTYPNGARYVAYAGTFNSCDWKGSGTGSGTADWHTGANWSVLEAPHDKDIVEISFTEPGTVNITANAQAYRLRAYGSGSNIEMQSGSSLFVYRSEYLGDSGTATFIHHGGTHTVGRDLHLGRLAGGTGSYNLSGGQLDVLNLRVGGEGTGVFNWTGGTMQAGSITVGTNGTMTVGLNWTHAGTLDIKGGSISLGSRELTLDGPGDGAIARMTSGYFSAKSEYVGKTGQGAVSQSGGDNSMQFLYLGYDAGSRGTYELHDGDVTVLPPNPTDRAAFIGYSGNGRFTQTGGSMFVDRTMFIGYEAGSEGEYQLAGPGTLTVSGGRDYQSEYIGFDGVGSFVQSDGNHVPSDSLYLGYNSSGQGRYELSNGNLDVGNETGESVYVGAFGEGTFVQTGGSVSIDHGHLYVGDKSGGTGTYIQSAGSTVVSHNVYLGNEAGSSGTYELIGTGELSATNEYVGWRGMGTFMQTGGTNSSIILIGAQGSIGTYTLEDGTIISHREVVGDHGSGTFVQEGGTNTTNNELHLGYWSHGFGSYELRGGQLNSEGSSSYGPVVIGVHGQGEFIQTGGSHTVSDKLFVAQYSDSSGTYELSGTGTLTASSERIGIDGIGNFLQGAGVHNVNGTMYLGFSSEGFGLYTLELGQLTVDTVIVGRDGVGALTITGGNFEVASLVIGNSSGSGGLNLNSDTASVTISDKLVLGPNASLSAVPSCAIHMTGSAFENRSTNPADLAGLSNLTLVFEGGSGDIDPFEVPGAIDGDFGDNFALGGLQIGGADVGRVRLVDAFDNGKRTGGNECLFTRALVVNEGSQLDLGGFWLYVDGDVEAVLDGWIANGRLFDSTGTSLNVIYDGDHDWTVVPEPATLSLLALGGLVMFRRRKK